MAYADKCCDMRRCCLVKGGHVQFEGVEFDDYDIMLRNRIGFCDLETTSVITKELLMEKIRDYNDNLMENKEPLKLLYQDDEDCNWDVKSDYLKSEKAEVENDS